MKTEYAQAASQLKKELKEAFPNTKFSVRSEGYAGGCSVNVKYTDGPKNSEVEAIANKYKEGHFDGMIDMYEYSNQREDIPQAKYVFVDRKMSEETKERIIKEHNDKYCEEGQINDLNSWNEDKQAWNSQVVHSYFVDLDLAEASE